MCLYIAKGRRGAGSEVEDELCLESIVHLIIIRKLFNLPIPLWHQSFNFQVGISRSIYTHDEIYMQLLLLIFQPHQTETKKNLDCLWLVGHPVQIIKR